ncbi:MAG TPA: DUF748 domain-containing protein [Myxococcota bacterium]|nr:DUF748 domain-containing protein [Myxococcota bacterium]
MSRGLKIALGIGVGAALLALAAVVGFRAAVEEARQRVVAALGRGARIESLRVTTRTVELSGLEIPGGADWPAPDALRADRVVIEPSLRSLASPKMVIRSVAISNAYLSALRTRDGSMHVVPTLLEGSSEPAKTGGAAVAPPVRSVAIERIEIDGGQLEIYDASVARTPWRLHLDGVRAEVRNMLAPTLASAMPFELEGELEGPKRKGRLALRGQIDGATRDLDLDASLRGADLLAFEPYLLQASDVRLSGGVFDLAFDAKVRARRVHAPGRLSISDLALAPGGSAKAIVMGVPRDLLVESLAAHGNHIDLAFTLEGDLDDPRFSLNEAFGTRIAVSMAETLGLSVRGLVEGVGKIGGQSIEGVGKAARGVGSTLKGLLPRPRD